MPFFTNDWNLKDAYSDPGAAVQQEKSLDKLGNIFSDAKVGTMAQPGVQTSQQSLGAVSGMPPTDYPFYSGASPDMPTFGGVSPSMPGMLSGGDFGGAYDEMFGTGLSSYDSLQAWQNASPMQRKFIGSFNPYGGQAGINLAHGINPLPDFITPEGWQTTPWYEGETDYFGNPMSADALADSGILSGFGSMAEANAVWGSDEHFNAITDSFNFEEAATTDSGGLFSDIVDTVSDAWDDVFGE